MRFYHFLALLPPLFLSGCDGHDHDAEGHGEDGHSHDDDGAHGGDAEGEHGGHVHEAPRGGTLVVLREEFAHLEVILDAEKGDLHVWVLDAHCENPVRISAPGMELVVEVDDQKETVNLVPQASTLTGETLGDSSEFLGSASILVGTESFRATLKTIEVKGSTFEQVAFGYPEGNE